VAAVLLAAALEVAVIRAKRGLASSAGVRAALICAAAGIATVAFAGFAASTVRSASWNAALWMNLVGVGALVSTQIANLVVATATAWRTGGAARFAYFLVSLVLTVFCMIVLFGLRGRTVVG
jgi:hypothetical protein